MIYIDDPCHGFDDDPRSPYYKDLREQVGTCDLCGEPLYEGERIIIYGEKVFHYDDVFSNIDDQQIAELFGFEITKEVGIPCAYCKEETDEWEPVVKYNGKTYHFDCFFNLPDEDLAELLGFQITIA